MAENIREYNNAFNVGVAMDYGIHAALIYASIKHWVLTNERNKRNYFEGRTWVYNSVSAWCELFPYITRKQIRIALDLLESEGLIVSGTFNKMKGDRTKWYSPNHLPPVAIGTPPANKHLKKGKAIAPEGIPFAPQGKAIPINTSINTQLKEKYSANKFASPKIEEIVIEESPIIEPVILDADVKKEKNFRPAGDGPGEDKKDCPEYTDAMRLYFDFYAKHNGGAKPVIRPIDGRKLKDIISYCKKYLTANGGTSASVVEFIKAMFDNWAMLDAFMQKRMTLKEIDSDMDKIIRTLKNGGAKYKAKTSAEIEAEQKLNDWLNE